MDARPGLKGTPFRVAPQLLSRMVLLDVRLHQSQLLTPRYVHIQVGGTNKSMAAEGARWLPVVRHRSTVLAMHFWLQSCLGSCSIRHMDYVFLFRLESHCDL